MRKGEQTFLGEEEDISLKVIILIIPSAKATLLLRVLRAFYKVSDLHALQGERGERQKELNSPEREHSRISFLCKRLKPSNPEGTPCSGGDTVPSHWEHRSLRPHCVMTRVLNHHGISKEEKPF